MTEYKCLYKTDKKNNIIYHFTPFLIQNAHVVGVNKKEVSLHFYLLFIHHHQ